MTQTIIITGKPGSGKTTLAHNLASCYPKSEIEVSDISLLKTEFPFRMVNSNTNVLIIDNLFRQPEIKRVFDLLSKKIIVQKPYKPKFEAQLKKVIIVWDGEPFPEEIIPENAKLYDTSKIISPCQSSTTK